MKLTSESCITCYNYLGGVYVYIIFLELKWIEALELKSEAQFWFRCIIIVNLRNYKQVFPFSYLFHYIIIVDLRNYKQVFPFSYWVMLSLL